MNGGKVVSGVAALSIYLGIIFLILFFYNIHKTKAKNYVEKNSDRVTVTLVNSDKTVFNKSSKVSTPTKPVPLIVPPVIKKVESKKQVAKKVIPKKVIPRKTVPKKTQRAVKPIPKPKKHVVKKHIPKKVIPKKHVPKKHIPKKVKPKKVIPKRIAPKKAPPKKHVPKKIKPKKHVPKKVKPKKPKKVVAKRPKKVIPKPPKKHVPKKIKPKKHIPKKPKKSAKDLFSSVKTKTPVKRTPKHVAKRPVKQPAKRPSAIKHSSSVTDRIKATHQSGRTSNANRDKGIKNAYIAKIKRHMNNWSAVGAKGQMVTINLTIYNSGKFRYTASGVSGAMKSSLKRYLDTLNRMGVGRHKKSSPYSIQVRFRVH